MFAPKSTLALTLLAFSTFAAPLDIDKKDQDAIRATVGRFFDAFGKRDTELLGETLAKEFATTGRPSKEAYLKSLGGYFDMVGPGKYEATVHTFRKEGAGTVAVRVEFKGKFRPKGKADDIDDKGQWVVTLVKQGDGWKIASTEAAELAILKAVLRANTKAERLAILRREGDEYVEQEFLTKVFNEQGQLADAGEFGKAEFLQEIAELATEAIEDEDDRLHYRGLCLLGKGNAAMAAERYDDASLAYEEALVLYRKKGWKGLELAIYPSQMVVLYKQGDYSKAIALGEKVRAELQGDKGGVKLPIALLTEIKVLGNLGLIYGELGNYRQAVKDLEESLRRAEDIGDVSGMLTARMNLAKIRQEQGRHAEAIQIYEAVLSDARRIGQRRVEGQVLNNIGLAQAELGRSGQGIKTLEEARKLAASVKNRQGEGNALGNLALVHFQLGAGEDAERYNREALKLFEAVGDKAGVARCWKLASMMHTVAGRKEEAEKALAAYAELVKQRGSKQELAQLSMLLGLHYEDAGQVAKASAAYSDAIRASRELGDSYRETLLRFRKASMRQPKGGFEVDLFEIAKLEKDVARLDDPRLSAPYFHLLAELHTEKKEWPEAATQLRKAIAAVERRVAGNEDPQLSAMKRDSETTQLYSHLVWVLHHRGDAGAAFQAADQAKARSLTDMLQRGGKSIQRGMTVAERTEEEQLRGAVMEASRRYGSIRQFAANDPKAGKEITKALADAEANYEAFRRRLFTTHPELRVQQADLPEVNLVELQKSLFATEPDLAILLYLVRRDVTLIFVVTAGEKADGPAKVTIRTVAVKETELANAAEDFWKSCQNPRAGRPLSDDLWKWLIEPVEKELAGKKHLVIVPGQPLLTVPFQAISSKDTEPYLIERYAVSYAPSVSALLEMRRRGNVLREQRRDGAPVVAVGGVNFTSDLKPLPASGPEAEAVAKTFGERARVLLGDKAKRAEIMRAVPPCRVLHFATHGLPNSSRPLFSALAVTPSGANDDGRLYAHDITNLELSAELVVLSACETARGREFRGEGTIGLAWAFFVAGSPAVVVSQWSVADDSTADLMSVFYSRLQAGKDSSRAEALRQAQLTLLKQKKTKHPMFWAPFVLIGDWR